MKKLNCDYPDLAFVDIETTGGHFERDRITELAIKTLANGELSIWESLINPETYIPRNIQLLTGITTEMVIGQPTFADLASTIARELEGKIFVAHNARFDYGFIKASLKRVGIDFKPKILCTVKLSRLLFPNQARHNLDTIIAEHKLSVSARHRAMGDADVLYQFWQVCENIFGKNRLLEAINQLVGNASLPPNIDQALIDSIPNTPGCYIFYGENKSPLYIGKSVALRSRVLGHFHSALTQRKEMKLSLLVRDIEWITTGGELSALILESQLIKERMPSLNVKLRRSRGLCAWSLVTSSLGILTPVLVNEQDLLTGFQDNWYGIFMSKREANAYLKAIAKKYHLCEALLGLEKGGNGKPCFGFQVKQCAGACIGMVQPEVHNLQLSTVMGAYKLQVWPYQGAIAIRDGAQMIVLDNWCYRGTAVSEEELYDLANSKEVNFDIDIYKIIKKALKGPYKNQIVRIGEQPCVQ